MGKYLLVDVGAAEDIPYDRAFSDKSLVINRSFS
jgi:hypothetical protein